MSLESLESDCKRTKLSLSYESIRSGEITDTEQTPEDFREEQPADSPESPDESLNSEVFIVEGHSAPEDSASSSRVLHYLEEVAPEDSNSFFITPPGPLKGVYSQNASPLNALEKRRNPVENTTASVIVLQYRSSFVNLGERFDP